ncbi:tetratricopeptide repeat-containing sensor histidine kinase [Psychroflexus planctonicus]|uniref:tetratricopeptide repeat-containing sensor histidine kinase n=1 Tax=Psychroflexus planctonicus TaxID=1526575 RepID=UPI00166A89F1|nr:tetratricopeptide repeat protein [Psychroflexus planctonicus]
MSKKKSLFIKSLFIILCAFQSGGLLAQEGDKLDGIRKSLSQQTNDSLRVLDEIKYTRALHRNKHDQAEEYEHAQNAIDLALQLKDTLLYARALDNSGLLHRFHEQYNEAIDLHAKAFQLVREKDVQPIHKMIFANNAGVAARYNQNYDTALSFYLEALKIAEEEENLRNIAISSNGIGNTLAQIEDREDEALAYFQRALEAEKKRDNTLGMAMNYLSISDFYINKEDYITARSYLDRLIEINEERDDLYGLAITQEFLGISYLNEGTDLNKAVFYFEESLAKFKKIGSKHKQSELLNMIADAYKKQKKGNLAETYYKQSLNLAEELNQFGLISSNSLALSKIYENKNYYNEALSYLKIAKSYEYSIQLNEQKIKIEAIKSEYDLDKKENQIALLEIDKELQNALLDKQEEKIKRREIVTISLGIGLVLILVVFILQYRNFQTRKRINAKLAEEEKDKLNAIYERNLAQAEILVSRLRLNPHFLFNSLNAITYLIQSEQNYKAIKYLKIFSKYTRMVLETSKEQVISLKDELQLTRNYLMLEGNRFEKDFTFKIIGEDSTGVEKVFIPPLLLQPFLENAIWHGLLLSENQEKFLNIEVDFQPKQTKIYIDDNGVGRQESMKIKRSKSHKSMGMQIIKERIELYNKTHANTLSFEVIDKKDQNNLPLGTQIVISISKS